MTARQKEVTAIEHETETEQIPPDRVLQGRRRLPPGQFKGIPDRTEKPDRDRGRHYRRQSRALTVTSPAHAAPGGFFIFHAFPARGAVS